MVLQYLVWVILGCSAAVTVYFGLKCVVLLKERKNTVRHNAQQAKGKLLVPGWSPILKVGGISLVGAVVCVLSILEIFSTRGA